MAEVDRSHRHACDPIPGSSKLHSIYALDWYDPTKLLVRKLACFCVPCLEEKFSQYEKQAYIQQWKVLKIRPHSVEYAAVQRMPDEEEDNWDYEYDDAAMADLVQVGNNFAVPATPDNDEGVLFYILQCLEPKRVVKENFECPWGGRFEVGDHVISTTYYQKWGRRELQNYVFLRTSQPAHVDASIVLACKFQMIPRQHRVKGGDPVYTLPEETLDVINSVSEVL
jgi:hypothetical protein